MIKKILKTIIIIAAAALAAFAALLLFLTATEYKPADTTPIAVEGTASESPKPGRSLRILTWNIGCVLFI